MRFYCKTSFPGFAAITAKPGTEQFRQQCLQMHLDQAGPMTEADIATYVLAMRQIREARKRAQR